MVWYRWLIGLAIVVPLAVVVSFLWQGAVSRRPSSRPELGVVDGRLTSCPATPNCVCSQDEGESSIAPLPLERLGDDPLRTLQLAVEKTGGKVEEAEGDYLRATYTSAFFGFVDDLECLVDRNDDVVQVRSSSRVGYSDLGANRRRVEALREIVVE